MERGKLRTVLADIRKTKRKLSQRELAVIMNCSQSMVSDYEYGRKNIWPAMENLNRWVDGLDLTLSINISRGRIDYVVTDLKDGQLWA